MSGRLRWTQRALGQLSEIEEYIAADDPAAAARFVARLRARARSAAKRPGIGRWPPEGFGPSVREVIESRYRTIYLVEEHGISVLYVGEGHRRPLVDDTGDP